MNSHSEPDPGWFAFFFFSSKGTSGRRISGAFSTLTTGRASRKMASLRRTFRVSKKKKSHNVFTESCSLLQFSKLTDTPELPSLNRSITSWEHEDGVLIRNDLYIEEKPKYDISGSSGESDEALSSESNNQSV
jgi:hypothetical protein